MGAYGAGRYGLGKYGIGADGGWVYGGGGTGTAVLPVPALVPTDAAYAPSTDYADVVLPPLVLHWIDPYGRVTDLTDIDAIDELGVDGLFAPPFDLLDEATPDLTGGSRLRVVRAKPRDVTIPIIAQQADSAALHALLRFLVSTMDPTEGDGILRAIVPNTDPDLVTARELVCRYTGGLEVSRAQTGGAYDNTTHRWQTAALQLRAYDPYWRDAEPVTRSFTYGSPTPFFPLLPLTLGSDVVTGGARVDNVGDAPAWPVWTVHGPCSSFTATDTTHDVGFTLAQSLGVSESVVIDTRPGRKTVIRSDGANLYSALTDDSALWPLRKGSTDLTLAQPGSTAGSYVSLSYALRYLTP